jgi:glyoxylase-like metal-dependent hydrolase (beta-lactamase superfamily II)
VAEYTIDAVVSAPFEQNAYLIWRVGQAEGLVIDPGFDTSSLLERLQRQHLGLAAILNTHGHIDHIVGNATMKQAFPSAPLVIGTNEAGLLSDPEKNLSAPFGARLISPDADRLVSDGDRINFGGFRFEVREIPGHSPGSVIYLCDEFDPPFVFAGDVLFAGSIGRTDLGGNLKQLLQGIRAKLFALPDGTLVYPGHGPVTTIGQEKRSNPFVGAAARDF